ncbi:DNA-binding transcriptional regulator, MarR family [Streptomyces zhaozhouensis]|uniref:DNA-binding transcriptional regulator, MarR family n=1 Tax=Streptomyces zhaozhouensis TaxID=1300267 RepID=A0A286DHQ1_9ACTN|nr:DNA-binding transcriptional regulator, MarR family [Streptomyces zhaozhouensis]
MVTRSERRCQSKRVTPPPRSTPDAARAASELVELLEVLWERGRDAASPAPVSPSQLRVLHVLEREEGINLRGLGEVLGAAPSSVSRLCDRLQALGYVEREQSPASRRELQLSLTPGGRAFLAELRGRRERALEAAIAAMAPGARRALVEGLAGFRAAVERVPPDAAAPEGPRAAGVPPDRAPRDDAAARPPTSRFSTEPAPWGDRAEGPPGPRTLGGRVGTSEATAG